MSSRDIVNEGETLAQALARRKANSLAAQLAQFAKTGRVTKGMSRAGYANVAPQEFVAASGDSPFSMARNLLGQDASEQAVAAFVQRQGWDEPFRQGKTYSVKGAFVTPAASASAAFFENRLGIPQGGVFDATNTTETTTGSPMPKWGIGAGTVKNYPPSIGLQSPTAGSGVQSFPGQRVGSSQAMANFYAAATVPSVAGAVGGVTPTPLNPWQQAVNNQYGYAMTPSLLAAGRVPVPTVGGDNSATQEQSTRSANTPGIVSGSAQSTMETFVAATETRILNNDFPPTLSDTEYRMFDWGVGGSPYIRTSGGEYTLDPNFVEAVNSASGYASALGSGSVTSGYNVGTNDGNNDTRGIYSYVRPRRGGGNIAVQYPRGYGGGGGFSGYNDYSGGGYSSNNNYYTSLSNWRMGF